MRYKAILFDLDGTLLDTTNGVLEAVIKTIKTLNLQMPSKKIIKTFVGPPMQDSFKKYFNQDDELALKSANLFREIYKETLFNAKLYDGVLELLNKLKENNFKIAIATNKSHDNAINILKQFKIFDYCDFAMGSDLNGKLKKSDIIKQCLDNLNINNKDSVMIGDSIIDAIGAKIVNIDFIAVTYGFGFKKNDNFDDVNKVNVCKNIYELQKYLLEV